MVLMLVEHVQGRFMGWEKETGVQKYVMIIG
jgi:hypothetical protein